MANQVLANQRMLIVDDDQNLLDSLFRALYRKFDIQVAASGHMALGVVRDHKPFDVVLCDWRMPGLDGMAFLDRVRYMAPFSIRIMMTGAIEDPLASHPEIAQHFHGFLRKPCSAIEIWQIIEEKVNSV